MRNELNTNLELRGLSNGTSWAHPELDCSGLAASRRDIASLGVNL